MIGEELNLGVRREEIPQQTFQTQHQLIPIIPQVPFYNELEYVSQGVSLSMKSTADSMLQLKRKAKELIEFADKKQKKEVVGVN